MRRFYIKSYADKCNYDIQNIKVSKQDFRTIQYIYKIVTQTQFIAIENSKDYCINAKSSYKFKIIIYKIIKLNNYYNRKLKSEFYKYCMNNVPKSSDASTKGQVTVMAGYNCELLKVRNKF